MAAATVQAVCSSEDHRFSKPTRAEIDLLEGLGVKGDAHLGKTVKHRSRVAVDPRQPNLRQVHLIHAELHQELTAKGFHVSPGIMGENITTHGIDLLALPQGTVLHLGDEAKIEVTGLRNPCKQLDDYQPGLLRAVLDRTTTGDLIRKAGIMAVVTVTGTVRPGDNITTHLPNGPHRPLECV